MYDSISSENAKSHAQKTKSVIARGWKRVEYKETKVMENKVIRKKEGKRRNLCVTNQTRNPGS